MKAILYQGAGDTSVIQMGQRPEPALSAGQVRIRVRASGVNRADIVQRKGLYPPPPGESDIPGLEVCGDVTEVGAGVTRLRAGDRVAALLASGGYAEEVVCAEGVCFKLPERLSYTDGAGLIETFVTAHHNLFYLGGAGAGSNVLVHAGASGVGTSAIQLLHKVGASVWVTVGSAEKAKFCEGLGAIAINYKEQKFAEEIRRQTEGQGVQIILDCVGGSYFEDNLSALAVGGTIIFIGTMGGREAKLDLGRLLVKRHRLQGSSLRPLPLAEKTAAIERFRTQFGAALEKGTIRPIIDSVFPAADVKLAHARMEANTNLGKIILTWL